MTHSIDYYLANGGLASIFLSSGMFLLGVKAIPIAVQGVMTSVGFAALICANAIADTNYNNTHYD